MFERFPRQQPESSPEQLRELLNQPEVVEMLNVHFHEYMRSGILDVYRQDLSDFTSDEIARDVGHQLKRPRDDIEQYLENMRRREAERYATLGDESPLLVGRIGLSDPESEDSYSYFLEKVDQSTGKSNFYSTVWVGSAPSADSPIDQTTVPYFSEEQREVIKRHYDEQVAHGIVYDGEFHLIQAQSEEDEP